jgi:hypothetical protein
MVTSVGVARMLVSPSEASARSRKPMLRISSPRMLSEPPR